MSHNYQKIKSELQWRATFKTTLSVAICIIIVNFFHFRHIPFIAPISVVVLTSMFKNDSWSHGIERILGPFIFTIIALALTGANDNYVLNILVMVVILLIGGYMFANNTFGYGALLGSLIASIVIYLNFTITPGAHGQGFHTRSIGWDFCLMSAIAVVVSTFVNEFIFPDNDDTSVTPQLTYIYEELAKKMTQGSQLTLQGIVSAKTFMGSCQRYLKAERFDLLMLLVERCQQHFIFIASLNEKYNNLKQSCDFAKIEKPVAAMLQNMNKQLNTIANAIHKHKTIAFNLEDFQHTVDEINKQIEHYRHHVDEKPEFITSTTRLLDLLSFIDSCRHFVAQLTADRELIGKIRQTKTAPTKNKSKKPQPFKINETAMKCSFRYSIVVIIMLTLHDSFGWYGGLQAIITSIVVVAQANTGRAKSKLWLRFLGIVIGGLIGLPLLIFLSTTGSFYLYFCALVLATFLLSLWNNKVPSMSYAAIQAMLLLYLILLLNIGPNNNFAIAWHRFIGVIEGGFVGFLVTAFIFPTDPFDQLRDKLYNTAAKFSALFKSASQQKLSASTCKQFYQDNIVSNQALEADVASTDVNSKEAKLLQMAGQADAFTVTCLYLLTCKMN